MSIQSELDLLNEQQLQAVLHNDSNLLILAGAGSGKTRVITVKIAYLIRELGINPSSILAVTFTNKAAGEMRERAAKLAPGAERVAIRTFHSFGAYMLRLYAEHLGLSKQFTICDASDSLSVLQEQQGELNKAMLAQHSRSIARAKDYCLSPDDDLESVSVNSKFPDVYHSYETFLRQTNNVDFGGLILYPIQLLQSNSTIRKEIQQRYKYIFVDEYQDSNSAQFKLLQLLAGEDSIVCAVGDDDQSIYRFRGAELRNILDFPKYFANTKTICLEENYRSTIEILNVADAVVRNNTQRYGKKLFSRRSTGIKPRVYMHNDELAEAAFCAEYIKQAIRRSAPGITAILYRTNAQSRVFESELVRANISYRIIGSTQFWAREEIKDALSYLNLVVNPRDLIAFRRVSRKFIPGFGSKSYEKVSLRLQEEPQFTILTALQEFPRGKKNSQGIIDFLKLCDTLRKYEGLLADRIAVLVEKSGILDYYEQHDPQRKEVKEENLDELIHATQSYGSGDEELQRFLDSAELNLQDPSAPDATVPPVALVTMHSTKGLEFERVIITGMEDEVFPGRHNEDEVEEERRLCYVAITRAKDELLLSCCRRRFIHRRLNMLSPSRFLAEIPAESVDVQHSPDRRSVRPTIIQRGEWTGGKRIVHDTYGKGRVIDVIRAGTRNCVVIKFDDGKVRQFLPEYTKQLRIVS